MTSQSKSSSGGECTQLDEKRTRRPHKKSRLGCNVCRRRRVKCDEEKPSCERCRVHGVECEYDESRWPAGSGRKKALEISETLSSPNASMFSMSLAATAENINGVLQMAFPGGAHPTSSGVSREHLQSLAHFEMFTAHTMGAPIARQILRTQVLPLAFSTPHLMHALLATSTAHLTRLIPSYKPRVPAEYHWHRAITLYQKEISSVQPENMDSIISTCMALAVHSFTSNDTDPNSSWVFPTGPPSNWLMIKGGLDLLVAQCATYVDKSIWFPLFDPTYRRIYRHKGVHPDDRPGIEGIPLSFVELCDLDENSTRHSSPYLLPLRSISALIKLDASSASFSKLVRFIGCMEGQYLALTRKRDPRALLILGYWFALMCMVDQWWVHNRVRLECRAICAFLENHGDPKIVRLLEFPVLACGYQMPGDFDPGDVWAGDWSRASSITSPSADTVSGDAMSSVLEWTESSPDLYSDSSG